MLIKQNKKKGITKTTLPGHIYHYTYTAQCKQLINSLYTFSH